jgi:hypothetical protein
VIVRSFASPATCIAHWENTSGRVWTTSQGLFSPKERVIADWLLAQSPGVCIHPRRRDPAEEATSPDAMVRTDPGDAGTITEYKTLKEGNSAALKASIRRSLHQLLPHGNGDVVVDGRPVALTEAEARRGYARFVGERMHHGKPMPKQVTIILGDGKGHIMEKKCLTQNRFC